MEIYFNELSLSGLDELSNVQVEQITETYKSFRKYDVTSCRISGIDSATLASLIRQHNNSTNIMNFYYAFFKIPFESDKVEDNQDILLAENWGCNGSSCWGLAVAFLLNSASFSIFLPEWDNEFIEISGNDRTVSVRHICTTKHIDAHKAFFEDVKEVELVRCDHDIAEKPIHLRDDHGKDTLYEFSKRIIQNCYICEIVRRHIVGGANRTLISAETPPRSCRIGTCRRLSAG